MAKAKNYQKNVRADKNVSKYLVEVLDKTSTKDNKTFKYFGSLTEARSFCKDQAQGTEARVFKISYDFIRAFKLG